MKGDAITCIFFSPTGTTRKIVEGIASGIAGEGFLTVDLTLPGNGHGRIYSIKGLLSVIGVPVYGGRVPKLAAERLRIIKGNDVPAVIVAVYGNREYDDALLELRDISMELGFKPIAAGAFIGEHSYHSDPTPIAPDRPDRRDMETAGKFGKTILGMLPAGSKATPLKVPGVSPYREWLPPEELSPVTDDRSCTLCKACESVCPAGVIDVGETVITDNSKCILCSACVKKCPTGARKWDADWIRDVRLWLSEHCDQQKEPEVFFNE